MPHDTSQGSDHALAGKAVDAARPLTLAIDIGGSGIKAAVLDVTGVSVGAQLRIPTPREPTPPAVLDKIAELADQLPAANRISAGFPGVVKNGKVLTTANLGTIHWAGFELMSALANRFGVPARVLNDAAVQGLGVVEGYGLECVLTLGTGVGCALFRNRRLLLPLELGQLRVRSGKTYDRYIGQAALGAKGLKRWNRRLRKTIDTVTHLTACDLLYLGGGNARKLNFEPPPHVRIVSNTAGLTGGIRLWEPQCDELFSNAHSDVWAARQSEAKT